MIKAIAIEGPVYAPVRYHVVEIICPDRVPQMFICKDVYGHYLSIETTNLKIKWEPPTYYESIRESAIREHETKIRELASNIISGVGSSSNVSNLSSTELSIIQDGPKKV